MRHKQVRNTHIATRVWQRRRTKRHQWRLERCRDGAAKLELIDSCSAREPAFCRMRRFVADVGSLEPVFRYISSTKEQTFQNTVSKS